MRNVAITAIVLSSLGCASAISGGVRTTPAEPGPTTPTPGEPPLACDTLPRGEEAQTIIAQFRVCSRGTCTEASTVYVGETTPELAIVGNWSTAHIRFEKPSGHQVMHFLTKIGPWEVAPGVSATRFLFSSNPAVGAIADMRAIIVSYSRVDEAHGRTIRGCAPFTLRPAAGQAYETAPR